MCPFVTKGGGSKVEFAPEGYYHTYVVKETWFWQQQRPIYIVKVGRTAICELEGEPQRAKTEEIFYLLRFLDICTKPNTHDSLHRLCMYSRSRIYSFVSSLNNCILVFPSDFGNQFFFHRPHTSTMYNLFLYIERFKWICIIHISIVYISFPSQ